MQLKIFVKIVIKLVILMPTANNFLIKKDSPQTQIDDAVINNMTPKNKVIQNKIK